MYGCRAFCATYIWTIDGRAPRVALYVLASDTIDWNPCHRSRRDHAPSITCWRSNSFISSGPPTTGPVGCRSGSGLSRPMCTFRCGTSANRSSDSPGVRNGKSSVARRRSCGSRTRSGGARHRSTRRAQAAADCARCQVTALSPGRAPGSGFTTTTSIGRVWRAGVAVWPTDLTVMRMAPAIVRAWIANDAAKPRRRRPIPDFISRYMCIVNEFSPCDRSDIVTTWRAQTPISRSSKRWRGTGRRSAIPIRCSACCPIQPSMAADGRSMSSTKPAGRMSRSCCASSMRPASRSPAAIASTSAAAPGV